MTDGEDPWGSPESERVSPRATSVRSRRMVGRDREIAEVAKSIASEPLTTLTGPGGVGKTALALAAAAASSVRFTDGVFVVWLASLRSADLVAGEVAAQVGMQRSSNSTSTPSRFANSAEPGPQTSRHRSGTETHRADLDSAPPRRPAGSSLVTPSSSTPSGSANSTGCSSSNTPPSTSTSQASPGHPTGAFIRPAPSWPETDHADDPRAPKHPDRVSGTCTHVPAPTP